MLRILKRLLLRLGLALLVTALGLLLAEGVVRVAGLGAPPQPTATGQDQRKSADPLLRMENNPGGRRVSTFHDRPGGEPRQAVHSINSLGLRGPETTVEKPDGVFRVACLGDSYTYGHGVGDDETWPAILQTRIDARSGPGAVEVLNFGVRAYETEQEVRQLESRVLDFEPDVVLLCWFFNDNAIGPAGESFDLSGAPWIVRTLQRPNQGWVQSLRERSRLFDLAIVRLYVPRFTAWTTGSRADLYSDAHPGWRRAKAALRKARDLLADRGIPFMVVLYPTLYRSGEHLSSHDAYEIVQAFCRGNDIPHLDLEPAFLPHDVRSLHVHTYNSHPNGFANALAAETIGAELAGRGLLPSD